MIKRRLMHRGTRNGVQVTKWSTDRLKVYSATRRMIRAHWGSYHIESQVFLEKVEEVSS